MIDISSLEYPYLSASLSMNPSRVKTARSLNATVSTPLAVSESLAQFSAGFDNLSPVMYLFGLILINTEDALLKMLLKSELVRSFGAEKLCAGQT